MKNILILVMSLSLLSCNGHLNLNTINLVGTNGGNPIALNLFDSGPGARISYDDGFLGTPFNIFSTTAIQFITATYRS